jgi:hypothetical protein
MSDRLFLRVGGGAAVVGAVLALVGNLLHPRYDAPDADIYRSIAASDRFRVADFILIAALILLVGGTVAVARSMSGGVGGVLSDYGRLAAVVGGTIAIAGFGVETFAFKQQTSIFVGALQPDVNGAFWATEAIDRINTALFDTWTVVFLGVAPLLLGIAMLRTRRYPAWLGVLGTVGGAVCLVVGCINLGRQDQTTTQVPFLVGSLLITAWLLGAGALLFRMNNDEASRAAAPASVTG